MPGLIKVLLDEANNRKKSGRIDFRIPIRPDHGIKIINDFNLKGNPGYQLLGRLKGLAEITGMEQAILNKI
jgi:mannonate dehydratase